MEIVMRMRNSERLSESGLTEMFQRMSVDCLEGYTKTSKRVGRMKDGNLYVIPTPDSFPEQPLHDAMWRVAAAACGSHIAAASKKLIGRPALVAAFNRYIASNQMYMSVRGSSDQLRSFRLTPSNCDIFVVGESQEFKLPVRLSAKVYVAYSTRSGNLTSKSTVTLPSEVVVYADNVSVAEAIKSHVEAIAEAGRACLPLYRVGAVRG